jgi:hypothetical protein
MSQPRKSTRERTFFFGLKKFAASAVAGSSMGRSTILSNIGEDASGLLSSLHAATRTHRSASEADELQETLFKLLLKVLLLQDEGLLDKESTAHVIDPFMMLLRQLLNTFSRRCEL